MSGSRWASRRLLLWATRRVEPREPITKFCVLLPNRNPGSDVPPYNSRTSNPFWKATCKAKFSAIVLGRSIFVFSRKNQGINYLKFFFCILFGISELCINNSFIINILNDHTRIVETLSYLTNCFDANGLIVEKASDDRRGRRLQLQLSGYKKAL